MGNRTKRISGWAFIAVFIILIMGCNMEVKRDGEMRKAQNAAHIWSEWSTPEIQEGGFLTDDHVIQYKTCSHCGKVEVRRTY